MRNLLIEAAEVLPQDNEDFLFGKLQQLVFRSIEIGFHHTLLLAVINIRLVEVGYMKPPFIYFSIFMFDMACRRGVQYSRDSSYVY
ncbi:hypothetical protein H5410_056939 [Solanum commersonii]|uniref:Uncharacterized protein n=1 Tax=Solanum commersonii TaxID=4109 RepID=A0A9J5WN79_SOLCO|nr:hypothetical protein H5410_056939 [Solanum commersonii]